MLLAKEDRNQQLIISCFLEMFLRRPNSEDLGTHIIIQFLFHVKENL